MNQAQLDCYHTAANSTTIVAGRRFGKTHGVVAPWLLRNALNMSQSTGGIVCSTFQQALTRTLPGTVAALEDMGYKRGVHFFIGIRPPESAGFAKPLREPISYDKVISWFNGSIQILISQDVAGSSNSLTLQYVMGDEAKFINFDKLKDETLPANGGFPGPWKDSPWLNSTLWVSDMPTTKKGSWFLNNKQHATPELVEGIKVALAELSRLSKLPSTPYTIRQINKWSKDLALMRKNAVYYAEYSSIENVAILGEKYIRDMRRDLPPLVFLTSILCVRPGRTVNGFYPGLTNDLLYSAFDNARLELIGYNFDEARGAKCKQDGDLIAGQPLCIAFDYNANINWLAVGQVAEREMRTLKSFYVKYERKLRELVDDFCDYYSAHSPHEVVYYYDSTAVGNNYAVDTEDFASTIVNQFSRRGWLVIKEYLGSPMRHSSKYHIIFEGMTNQSGRYLKPVFNEPNNEALILAMRSAGVRIGSQGFAKDKAAEKYAESEENPLELRTDGTDAWDTLYLGCNLKPSVSSVSFGTTFF